jgi:hypothetical protein
MREFSDGSATVSTYTAPVNQSLGPRLVSRVFLVIRKRCLLAGWVLGPQDDARIPRPIERLLPGKAFPGKNRSPSERQLLSDNEAA